MYYPCKNDEKGWQLGEYYTQLNVQVQLQLQTQKMKGLKESKTCIIVFVALYRQTQPNKRLLLFHTLQCHQGQLPANCV